MPYGVEALTHRDIRSLLIQHLWTLSLCVLTCLTNLAKFDGGSEHTRLLYACLVKLRVPA